MKLGIALVAAFVVQCGDRSKVAPPRPPARPAVVFKVGDVDADGRLIFWQIDAFDHMEPFTLKDDYGVILANEGGEEAPSPRYILAQQSTKEITNTTDFSIFVAALAKVPRGSTVGRYDTCSVPRAWGLPIAVIDKFEAALKDRNLVIVSDERGVCYCPNNY
jgi:hypothetical protein